LIHFRPGAADSSLRHPSGAGTLSSHPQITGQESIKEI
jgi:hypothetical protein